MHKRSQKFGTWRLSLLLGSRASLTSLVHTFNRLLYCYCVPLFYRLSSQLSNLPSPLWHLREINWWRTSLLWKRSLLSWSLRFTSFRYNNRLRVQCLIKRDCAVKNIVWSQTQLTTQESTLTSVTFERDELAEEKTGLEEKLMALQSQTHELQVRRVYKKK